MSERHLDPGRALGWPLVVIVLQMRRWTRVPHVAFISSGLHRRVLQPPLPGGQLVREEE